MGNNILKKSSSQSRAGQTIHIEDVDMKEEINFKINEKKLQSPIKETEDF